MNSVTIAHTGCQLNPIFIAGLRRLVPSSGPLIQNQQIFYAPISGEVRAIPDDVNRDLWGRADLSSPVVVWPLPPAYKMVSTT
jgi:hypothetical protein